MEAMCPDQVAEQREWYHERYAVHSLAKVVSR